MLAQPQPQSQHGELDASPALFTVLAAINAAGYDADLDSNANSPIRKQLRDVIAAKHLESVEALKKFFAHAQASESDRRVESVHLVRPDTRRAARFSVPDETRGDSAGCHDPWRAWIT